MRRRLPLLAVVLANLGAVTLVAFALGAFAGASAAKAYTAELYTSDLRVQEDGSLLVTETIRFRFEKGDFTHVWRTLPLRKLDAIEEIESPDPIVVNRRHETISVRWNFPPIHDTTRTFVLSYRARGVMRRIDGKPVLRWTAFPVEHAYRIERARAQLSWPPAWPAPEGLTTGRSGVRPMQVAGGALFEFGSLRPERTAVIEADFGANAPSIATPGWQLQRERWNRQNPIFFAITGILLLLGGIVVARMYRSAIAPAPLSRSTSPQTTPPSELSPILAGPVCDGRVWLRHVIAGLIDLAARGAVSFEMSPRQSVWAGKKYRMRRGTTPTSMGSIGQAAIDSAFRKCDPDGSVEIRKAWTSLMRDMKGLERLIRAELEQRGEFDPAVAEGGRRISRFGFVLLVLAAGAGLLVALSFDRVGPGALAPVAALGVLGTISIAVGANIPLQSAAGRAHSLEWKSFARSLKDAARGSSPVDAERYARWLPYAIAFGASDAWLRAGKKWNITPPPWLQGFEGNADGMAAWVAVFGATAGSHGGAGAGGAGGAAGGGGSGAG
jgi:hypothetical protein